MSFVTTEQKQDKDKIEEAVGLKENDLAFFEQESWQTKKNKNNEPKKNRKDSKSPSGFSIVIAAISIINLISFVAMLGLFATNIISSAVFFIYALVSVAFAIINSTYQSANDRINYIDNNKNDYDTTVKDINQEKCLQSKKTNNQSLDNDYPKNSNNTLKNINNINLESSSSVNLK